MLAEILSNLPAPFADKNLLIGHESNDDAAVYAINDSQAVVATTDFFMPIVDDPYDFGRIAAANALSDVYAIGGRPIFALAIAGIPVGKLSTATVGRILAGGAAVCAEAGIAVAGGHTIDTPEPIYGLVAIGLADPAQLKRNNTGQAGDVLILGKGLGTGILSAAFKADQLDAAGYDELLATTTKLNAIGLDFAAETAVHAMTDVTGFGLLGHLLEMCRGAGLAAAISWDKLPILASAEAHARAGVNTGAAGRNWQACAAQVKLPAATAAWQQNLLSDPQTSGGLLLAVAPEAVADILAKFHAQGFQAATVIGKLAAGDPNIEVIL